MKLKIGQQFEVVEVLTEGDYLDTGVVKAGGRTIALDQDKERDGHVLANGSRSSIFSKSRLYGCVTAYMYGEEVKPVGRLTVTKVK